MKGSTNALRVGSGRRVVPVRRAVLGKQRPISPYFTISFGGPGAVDYFSSVMAPLSHCSYKLRVTGSMHEISFDTIPAKRRNVEPKRGRNDR